MPRTCRVSGRILSRPIFSSPRARSVAFWWASKPIPLRPAAVDKAQAELDRVLDKISASGMGSLTPDERKFLDEVAKNMNEH